MQLVFEMINIVTHSAYLLSNDVNIKSEKGSSSLLYPCLRFKFPIGIFCHA